MRYKCPDCNFSGKWEKVYQHLENMGHGQGIQNNQKAQKALLVKTAEAFEMALLLQHYALATHHIPIDAETIPTIFQRMFKRNLIWPEQFPNLLSWLTNIPGVVVENGTNFGVPTFVSYNNTDALSFHSYPPPRRVAGAPTSFSLKTAAGLNMELLSGDAYDGVQRCYKEVAAADSQSDDEVLDSDDDDDSDGDDDEDDNEENTKVENQEDEGGTKEDGYSKNESANHEFPLSLEQSLGQYFAVPLSTSTMLNAGISLADGDRAAKLFPEASLLGHLIGPTQMLESMTRNEQRQVYLNTHEPFCLVTVGVQGGGKSHTLASVLEGLLIPFPENNLCRLSAPMTTLVLHYDQSSTSLCEATGLRSPAPALQRILGPDCLRCVPKERMTVLVSPSYYLQRKKFYGDYCHVKPLLLRWRSLTANHIKSIMGINETDNQLYVSVMLNLLRLYQRKATMPSLDDFFTQVRTACTMGTQKGPLEQRIALFESLIAKSKINEDLRETADDLYGACQPGHLVVCDLTDPLLSALDVNGIFQVLVEQYRTLPLPVGSGRALALDEAHKFMDGVASDGLSTAIVNIARLMRHDGIRLIVSTQSPTALAPELLELVTVSVLHRFHSKDWHAYLEKKLPLSKESWDLLLSLSPGQALVFASRQQVFPPAMALVVPAPGEIPSAFSTDTHPSAEMFTYGPNCLVIQIRPRFTADRGASVRNKKKGK